MKKSEVLKIFLCGDTARVGREIHPFLSELGHTVVEAGDSIDDIRDLLTVARPDLAFVACTSPCGQGLDLIREIQGHSPVPLVLLAEQSPAPLLREAGAAGAGWVLQVPADAKSVAGAIDIARVRHQDFLELRDLRERMRMSVRAFLHRVKNDLAVIASLMHFQADSCTNAGAAAALLEGADRVRVVSALYDIIRSSEYRDVLRLDHYLELLLSKMGQGVSAESGISLAVSADCVCLDGARALSCGLIVRELVANALQYAFSGNGRSGQVCVAVRNEPANDFVEIRVGDNGRGLPADVDPARATTFGLQLVSVLVGQLKGTMEVGRSGGTTVTIRFKAPGLNTIPAEDNGL
jgi:two-component sensor histidine kinase